MNEKPATFEQGPIRPPNEARSLLLRLTRNCPWNQCLFCPVYKRDKFSLRTVEEIKEDILSAKQMADDIKALSSQLGHHGAVNDAVISTIFNQPDTSTQYRSIAAWLYYRTDACFLQDADNLIMKTKDLVAVLQFLKAQFPKIKRVTTYSRSRTVIRKSVDALKQIRAAGLDRVHIGLESGFDPLFAYNSMTASGVFEDGKLIIKDTSIDSPSMGIAIEGNIDLIKNKVDLIVLVAPFKTVDRIVKIIPLVGNILGGNLISIPFRAIGDLGDPDVIPLSPTAVGSGLLGILERTLKLPITIIQPVLPGSKDKPAKEKRSPSPSP